jgi:hypothetical protein
MAADAIILDILSSSSSAEASRFHRGLAFQFSPQIHIVKHSLPGFIDAQGFTLAVDVGDHFVSGFNGVGLEVPHAAVLFLHFFEQVLGNFLASLGRTGHAEDGVDPGGDEILTDGDSFSRSSIPARRPRGGR